MKIPKNTIRVHHAYYIWQTEAYGKDYYISDVETCIYKYHPMPCTPAGDLIEKFHNLEEALKRYSELIREIK